MLKLIASHHTDLTQDPDQVLNSSASNALTNPNLGSNTVILFTGRWKFLKIQFPYLFANLRVNGGVIDRIRYMMMNYDDATHENILNLQNLTNSLFEQEIITLNYMGYPPGKPPSNAEQSGLFAAAYYELIQDILRNPNNRYFKVDDDVIYIHPRTFENMILEDNSSACTLRFANIAGANWRCSYIHQAMGLYNDSILNPKTLQFGFRPDAECGWKSLECAQLSLNTFLSLHKRQNLNRYLLNSIIALDDKLRFSVNFFMISYNSINFKALAETWPIGHDDEDWWTVKYMWQRPILIASLGTPLLSTFPILLQFKH